MIGNALGRDLDSKGHYLDQLYNHKSNNMLKGTNRQQQLLLGVVSPLSLTSLAMSLALRKVYAHGWLVMRPPR